MFEKIKLIINDWDPIKLFPFVPSDEYYSEINQIIDFLETKNSDVSTEELAQKIIDIFIDMFDESMFTKSFEECELIARKIFGIENDFAIK